MATTNATVGGDREAALAALGENPTWYHTIDLAPGVTTPGFVDWRAHAAKILPADMTGMRALDVGTFDGFWAFEMERRGAQVTAIDVEKLDAADWPPVNREQLLAESADHDVELGRGFRLAHGALGSSVNRVITNVYDVTPEKIGGQVDFVFLGALLLHLREPIRALEALHAVLKPGGSFCAVECVSLRMSILHPKIAMAGFEPFVHPFNWWRANLAGHKAMLRAAGFIEVDRFGKFYNPPAKREMKTWYLHLNAKRAA